MAGANSSHNQQETNDRAGANSARHNFKHVQTYCNGNRNSHRQGINTPWILEQGVYNHDSQAGQSDDDNKKLTGSQEQDSGSDEPESED